MITIFFLEVKQIIGIILKVDVETEYGETH